MMSIAGQLLARMRRAGVALIRRHPFRAIALLALFSVAGVCLGGYGWAVYTWRQAQVDYEAKRFDEAERRLVYCRRIWTDDPGLLLLSAKTSRRRGEFDSAQEYLTRYFRSDPESREEAQVESLLLRVQMGDDEAVDDLFKRIEQGHPDSPGILETISLSYMRRLRYQAANACLTKWIELCPDQALPYERRGWVYEHTASQNLAYEDYVKALQLDPSLILVRLRLVELLLEQKKVPEVIPHLDFLMQQAPDRVEVKARLGMLRFLEGRSLDARRLLEEVEPSLAKNDAAPLVSLARLDVQEGRGADAERRLRRVIALDPTESDARSVLVTALRFQDSDQEAIAGEREYLKIRERTERVNTLLRDRADKPDATPEEWFEIGSIFMELQMESRALYWLDKTLAKDIDHQKAHRMLMEYHERKGERELAASHRRILR